ncbi:uncharacterized protein LOC143685948 isoform X2 [Tamandua tetradactyla]|uniref:uncharacterized protein LOC143685948 isoform X2 n=1 Tax=Tamandua tetradactyla TaxID=48850 RepID=UPI004053912E
MHVITYLAFLLHQSEEDPGQDNFPTQGSEMTGSKASLSGISTWEGTKSSSHSRKITAWQSSSKHLCDFLGHILLSAPSGQQESCPSFRGYLLEGRKARKEILFMKRPLIMILFVISLVTEDQRSQLCKDSL